MSVSPIADTIWRQITIRTKLEVIATQPVAAPDYIIFNVAIKRGAAYKVRVTLEPSDTYKVELFRIRGASCKTVAEKKDIYVEQLNATIIAICDEARN